MKLREYQSPQVNKLIRQLQNANEGALISAVGTGKTIVTAVVGDELIKRGIVKKVIVSAPFNTIVKEFPELRGKKILSGTANNAQYLIGNIEQSPNIKTLIDVITGNSSEFVSTSHHAMANHRVRTAVNQADDLSDLLLVIDEAHHCFVSDDEDQEENKDGTLLGEIAEKIKQKGGKILYVTATPYRTVGNQTNLIFDPLKCNPVIRTIGEQMRDGYAPSLNTEYIHVRDVKLINGGIAGIFGDLLTTRISDPQLKTLLPRIVKQWKTEKYPKTILLVPAGNADHTAQEVKKYLEEITFPSDVAKIRGRKHPSVLISVGDSGQVIEVNGKEMTEIECDKASGGRVYDIVIGCRKFDEGTDVSSASHIFMVGLPSSVRLFHQRTGRVLRDKKNIDGYAEWFGTQWVNTSKVVFFAPIGKKTKEFDYKVGRQLLHCIFAAESYQEYCESLNASQNIRIAFEDKHKKAKTEATRAELEEVMALLGNIELNELKDYSSNEFNELVKESLNPDMTVGERIDMIKSSTMSDAERVIALNNIVNHLPDDIKDKIDWDAIVNSIVKSVKKKKVAGFDVPPTSAISDVFDDVLREFYSVKITTNTERAVQQVFSSLSGETFKEWAEKCSQFMGENAGLMWVGKICDYIDIYGKLPTKEEENIYVSKLQVWSNDLGKKRSSLKDARNNINPDKHNRTIFYPSYDKLAKDRGYPNLFDSTSDMYIKSLNLICDYIDVNGKIPDVHDSNSNTRKLGKHLYRIRNHVLTLDINDKNQFLNLSTNRGYPNLLNKYRPDLLFNTNIENIKSYIKLNNTIPQYPSKLASFLTKLRKMYKKGIKIYHGIDIECSLGDYVYILSPDDNETKMLANIKCLCDYHDIHGMFPTCTSPDPDARRLATSLSRMRTLNKTKDELFRQSYLILATKLGYPNMFDTQISRTNYIYEDSINVRNRIEDIGKICDYMDIHNNPPPHNTDDIHVKKLSEVLSSLRKAKNNKKGIFLDIFQDIVVDRGYPNLFMNSFELSAINAVNAICDYIDSHNCLPSDIKHGMGKQLYRFRHPEHGNRQLYPSLVELIIKRGYPKLFDKEWKP